MNKSGDIYAELFSAVFSVTNFSTIVYFGPEELKEDCQIKNWLRWMGSTIPLLLWNSAASTRLHRFVDTELIFLTCLPAVYRMDFLKTVLGLLQNIRLSKLVIELRGNSDVQLVNRVLQFCYQNHMLNVILILEDFGSTHTLYSFDAYPVYKLNTQEFEKDLELYPDQLVDLKGGVLRTQPDLSAPNTILYYDQKGNRRILGYVWNMVTEFARKHNARLELYSEAMLRPLVRNDMLDLLRRGNLDIAANMQPVLTTNEMAYPVTVASWCTMMPKESLIDLGDSYICLMPDLTIGFLVLLWIIYNLFRGRWQRHRRLSSIGWLILTVLLAANFRGRLFSMFIAPPSTAHIDSYAALSRTKLRIFGLRIEYKAYDFDIRSKYSSSFKLTDELTELLTLRNSLNTTYAYTVTRTKWLLYKEMQSRLTRPLFYFSSDLCFFQYLPFSLVIPENSPHRQTLHHYLLQLTQSGLFAHWTSKSYDYMNQAGLLKLPKLSEPIKYRSLVLRDLKSLLYAYAVGMVTSFVILVCEIINFLFRRWMYL